MIAWAVNTSAARCAAQPFTGRWGRCPQVVASAKDAAVQDATITKDAGGPEVSGQ